MCLFSRDAAQKPLRAGAFYPLACCPISRRIRSQAAAAKSDALSHVAVTFVREPRSRDPRERRCLGKRLVSTSKITELMAGASVTREGAVPHACPRRSELARENRHVFP